jgi:hypothetical protein
MSDPVPAVTEAAAAGAIAKIFADIREVLRVDVVNLIGAIWPRFPTPCLGRGEACDRFTPTVRFRRRQRRCAPSWRSRDCRRSRPPCWRRPA